MIISANEFLNFLSKERKNKTVTYLPKDAITLSILCFILLDLYENEALSLKELKEKLEKVTSGNDFYTLELISGILYTDYSFSINVPKSGNSATLIRPSIVDLVHKISRMIGSLNYVEKYTDDGDKGKIRISDNNIKEIAWNRYKTFNS